MSIMRTSPCMVFPCRPIHCVGFKCAFVYACVRAFVCVYVFVRMCMRAHAYLLSRKIEVYPATLSLIDCSSHKGALVPLLFDRYYSSVFSNALLLSFLLLSLSA